MTRKPLVHTTDQDPTTRAAISVQLGPDPLNRHERDSQRRQAMFRFIGRPMFEPPISIKKGCK
jgi:hypothetical protein